MCMAEDAMILGLVKIPKDEAANRGFHTLYIIALFVLFIAFALQIPRFWYQLSFGPKPLFTTSLLWSQATSLIRLRSSNPAISSCSNAAESGSHIRVLF